MEKKPTDELMEVLHSSNSIQQYIAGNGKYLLNVSLSEYLNQLVKEKQLVKSTVIKQAEFNEIYGYQIFSGVRKPSRDKLLSLCVGMVLSLTETQQTLKFAGLAPLYPKNKRDSILIFGIEKQQSICSINEMLYSNDEDTLK